MNKEETRREGQRGGKGLCLCLKLISRLNLISLAPSLGKRRTSEGFDLDSNRKGNTDHGSKEAVERH